MEKNILELSQRYLHCVPDAVMPLGGGFYGRVFLVEAAGKRYVFKLYLAPNLAQKEACALRLLAKHAHAPMPAVYHVDKTVGHGAVIMAYIDGVNAGKLDPVPQDTKEALAEQMVENLLAYHRVIHEDGFGQLEDAVFVADWRDYYHPFAEDAVRKAEKLCAQKALDEAVLATLRQALDYYDRVFYLPVREACLIHGDYNTWNVLLTKDFRRIAAVIDPFNCCWADSEFDLYQLDNANGKAFGLLAAYEKKRPLSENFLLKRAFYELFTELHHFFDAGVPISQSSIPLQAAQMSTLMKKL